MNGMPAPHERADEVWAQMRKLRELVGDVAEVIAAENPKLAAELSMTAGYATGVISYYVPIPKKDHEHGVKT